MHHAKMTGVVIVKFNTVKGLVLKSLQRWDATPTGEIQK